MSLWIFPPQILVSLEVMTQSSHSCNRQWPSCSAGFTVEGWLLQGKMAHEPKLMPQTISAGTLMDLCHACGPVQDAGYLG